MSIECFQLDHGAVLAHIDELAELLCDGVNGGASMSFVAPFPLDDARAYWRKVADGVTQGKIIVLAALKDTHVVGSVQLALAWQPNSPHRAEIQKLLVHSTQRRQGIALQLMQTAEDAAKAVGRWLLILDTERGSGAQFFYEKAGYQQVGIIPEHSLNGENVYADTVIFCKYLD